MKKKTILMTLMLLCAVAQGAWAQKPEITCIERSWNGSKVVETKKTITDYTLLEGNHSDEWLGIGGWYVVKGDVRYQTLNVFGDAHIILADDATLTCTGGILVKKDHENAKLSIYSQSYGDKQGKLIVTNSYDAAGIGSDYNENCGEIYIHGGNLDITGGSKAAAIGSAHNAQRYGNVSGKIYIYGGDIKAQGGRRGAGIGVGDSGHGHTLYGNAGIINIYDGTIKATGGKYGAGIGGGCDVDGGEVRIYGGDVTANGGVDAAGIGGGERGCGGSLYVYGGKVRAKGNSYGAGIGGGEFYTEIISVTGPYTNSSYSKGAHVEIMGGTVTAIAGEDCKGRDPKGGSAIGCGQNITNKGGDNADVLKIPNNYMVTGGDSENNIDAVFTADARIDACRWRNFVRIEACPHTAPTIGSDHTEPFTYTVKDADYHISHCRYCLATTEERHDYTTELPYHCLICGRMRESSDCHTVTIRYSTDGKSYNETHSDDVAWNHSYVLPIVPEIDGMTFMGYRKTSNQLTDIEMKDSEFLSLINHWERVELEDNETYYARYRYDYETEWTWNDDCTEASVSIYCNLIDDGKDDIEAEIYEVSRTEATPEADGEIVYNATAKYTYWKGYTYQFTDRQSIPLYYTVNVALSDTENNDEILKNNKRRRADITLKGRTLYKDGSWNTLYLPFSLSTFEGTPLEGATVKTLSSSSFADGTLTLNFSEDLTAIEEGAPYIVKWPDEGTTIQDPTFKGCILDTNEGCIETDFDVFEGSFSPVNLTGGDRSVLYLGADNKLYYPSADMTIGSCRAYIKLNGLTAGDLEADGVKAIRLDFGDGEATDIKTTNFANDTNNNDSWYAIDGRRLSGQPTQPGIYIHNGQKVMVK